MRNQATTPTSSDLPPSVLGRLLAVGMLTLGLASPVSAQEPPFPRSRPAVDEAAIPLPRPRPDAEQGGETEAEEQDEAPTERVEAEPTDEEGESLSTALARVYQAACPAVLTGQVEARMLPPLAERQCGERSPLAVAGLLVNGRMVPLSGEIVVSCAMASALPEWAADIDGFLQARENSGLARMLVGTSYACRNRNNAREGALSEHGFANALDVVGFELEDGRSMELPGGWLPPESSAGRALRFAHGAACARFTTTLGPEANALHADHLHVDLGCHGQQCTARICE